MNNNEKYSNKSGKEGIDFLEAIKKLKKSGLNLTGILEKL